MSNIVPIYPDSSDYPSNPMGLWRRDQLYKLSETGKYVPRVGDLVADKATGLSWVISVTSGVAELSNWKIPNTASSDDDDSEIPYSMIGIQSQEKSEYMRVFINKNTTPYTLTIHQRYLFKGSQAKGVRVFKGTDISKPGAVISAMYDQNNRLSGTLIPLELVAVSDVTNVSIKVAMTGHTTAELDDGELVTVVVYGDSDEQLYPVIFSVQNTPFAIGSVIPQKVVTSIALESPFADLSTDNRFIVPVNVNLSGVDMRGVVNYSDNTRKLLPIDGIRFGILGLSEWRATSAGDIIKPILRYKLSEYETSYGVQTQSRIPYTTQQITMQAVEVKGVYSAKLFVYPEWVNNAVGYRLRAWMYTLDRDAYYDVTQYLSVPQGGTAFDGLLEAATQSLLLAVNLNEVNGTYAKYRHVQAPKIALLQDGDASDQRWDVRFTPGQENSFGPDLEAKVDYVNTNNYKLDVSCGFHSLAEWLRNVYDTTYPLWDTHSEDGPMVPSHFTLDYGSGSMELSVEQWNSVVTLDLAGMKQGDVIYLHFYRQMPTTNLRLATAGLVVSTSN